MKLSYRLNICIFLGIIFCNAFSAFAQEKESLLFLFRIENVKGCQNGYCEASIMGGQDIGITKLLTGIVIAKSSKENPSHEGIISEQATIATEGDSQTNIKVPVKSNQTLLVGDIFACKLSIPKSTKRSSFFSLAQNAIFFQSVYNKTYYTYYDALYALTPAKEKILIDSMVADIKFVANFYGKDKASFPVIKEGKHTGKNVLDAMLLVTPVDVYNFFKFVNVNSKPYLANNWKISETYATWLMNGGSVPLSEDEIKKQLLSATSEGQIKDIVEKNKNISSDFLKALDKEADDLKAARKYTDASKIIEIVITVAKLKQFQTTLAEAYWTKAGIASSEYRWEDVATAYEKASEAYLLDENPLMASLSLNNLGDAYNELGRYEQAEKVLSRGYKIQQDYLPKIKDKAALIAVLQPYVGLTLRNLGDSYFYMGKYKDALRVYQEAVSYFDKVSTTDQKNLGRKANTLSRIAKTYNKLGETEKRKQTLQDAIKIGEQLENKTFLAEVYKTSASMYYDNKEYADAKIYYQKTYEAYQKLNNRSEQIYALANVANLTTLLDNDYAKAETLFNQALKLAQEDKDDNAIAYCYRRIGDLQLNKGNTPKAQEYFENALKIAQKVQDKGMETSSLLSLGHINATRGNFPKSKEFYELALKVSQETNDKGSEISALSGLGWLNLVSGNYPKAQEMYNKGLEISKKTDNVWGIASLYGDMANLAISTGDYKKAEALTAQSDSIYRKLDSKESLVSNQMISGRLAYFQGNFEKSLKDFQEASEAMKKLMLYNENLCIALGNQADVLYQFKRYQEAEKKAQEAYDMAVRIKSERPKAAALRLHGIALLGQKKYPESEKKLTEAYNLAKQLNLPDQLIANKNYLSQLYYETKQIPKAEQSGNEVVALSQKIGYDLYIWETYFRFGLIYREKKDLEKSKEYLKKAVEVLEKMRNSVTGGEEAKKLFSNNESKLKVYGTLIDVLFEKNDIEEALSFMQQYNLAEMQSKFKNIEIQYQDKKKQENKERSKEIKTDLLAKKQELDEQLKKGEKEQDKQKIESLKKIITVKEEEYLNFVYGESALNSYQKQLANLRKKKKDIPANMAVLSYFIAANDLYIIVATQNSITGKKVKVKKSELDDIVTALRNSITVKKQGVRGNSLDLAQEAARREEPSKDTLQKVFFNQLAEKAYMFLINPVHSDIKDKQVLAIIPSGQLYVLPFQMIGKTLKDGSFSPLIEQYGIFYTNLGDIFDNLEQESSTKDLKIVAFGNPDNSLPSAEKEVKNIKGLYPQTQVFLKNDATEDKVKTLDNTFSILHFATHGVLDYDDPRNSYLIMAKQGGTDGKFEIKELFGSPLMEHLSLVVLSACKTAVIDSKSEHHNDPVSPASAFINQGVKSVVATMWNVDDDATSILMEKFYKNLKTMPLTDALRKAQVDLSKDPKFSSPYYWAPFVLIGNWK